MVVILLQVVEGVAVANAYKMISTAKIILNAVLVIAKELEVIYRYASQRPPLQPVAVATWELAMKLRKTNALEAVKYGMEREQLV